MAKIVVIGAGLTGLSAAYHLEKKGFKDYKLFEKEDDIGGLCRSVYQDGFTFDFTGHLLHTSDKYFRSLIEQAVGLDQLNIIARKSFIYSQNTYTRYPFQTNLYDLPIDTIVDCIQGYISRKKQLKNPKTFVQWVEKNFGAGFGKYFFYPYQKKIFAYDLNNICASWTGRFVPQTSLKQIIRGAFSDNIQSIGYNANFLYPKHGGIYYWIYKFSQQIKQPIFTNFCVQKIDLQQKIITFSNGHCERFEQLISTMPLDRLLKVIKEKASTSIKRATSKLLCNSVINFNLGVARPDLSAKHWIYYPEKQFPFYRLGFPHNFSIHMTPTDCSSLYGEFAYINKSKRWINNRIKQSIKAVKKLLSISEYEILTEKIIHISHAYVIYDFWREKNLAKLLTNLEKQSVYCVGRYGQWKYASMQEAVLDGKMISNRLVILPAKRTWYMPTTQQQPRKEQKQ